MNRFARALYRAATLLLPADFRRRNASELEDLYREALERAARRGVLAWTFAVVRGLWDVIEQSIRSRRASALDATRTFRPATIMESTLQDLRLAARSLRKSPGFAVTAVVMIGVGIGANTALFSVVNAALLRPPRHVAEPDRLVSIYTSDYSGPPYGASSLPDVEDFRGQTAALADVAAFSSRPVSLPNDEGVAETLMAEFVTGNYLDVLGVEAARGRSFSAEERDPLSGAAVAIMGHGLWTRRFGSDPAVIGSTLRVSGQIVTIIGVAPEGFGGMTPLVTPDFWIPLSSYALIEGPDRIEQRGSRGWLVVARLAPGATPGAAQEQLTALANRLRGAYPQVWTDVNGETRRVSLVADIGLPPQMKGAAVGFATLLVSVFVVTLLIACANLAHLTLARASRRRREVAMKVALGASRLRIARGLLAESGLVASLGGAAGVGLAWWLLGTTLSLPPIMGLELTLDLGVDRAVLAFSALLTLLTMVAVGLLPALRASRSDPGQALKGGRATDSARFRWLELRHLLVVGQVAASLVLLVGAGLMLKSVRAAMRLDPGFAVEGVATLDMNLGREGEESYDLFVQLVEELPARVARLPGVEAVSLTDALPLTPAAGQRTGVSVAGYEPGPAEDMEFQVHAVGPGFMDALAIEMLRGRPITEADDAEAPGVLVVNEAFAERFWPGEDPVGKAVRWGRREAQVVGLMRDILYRNLEDVGRPAFFVPLAQRPSTHLTLVARTSPGDEEALLPLMRAEARSLNDRLPVAAVRTMEQAVSTILLPRRIASWLLAVAGALGMLLAAAGLYGVMAFLVAERTREIGLRIALGARARDVVRRIVRRGVALSAVGALVGLVVAALVTRLLQSLLFEVSPLDPVVFSLMALAAILVAAAASWVPARRASSVDPMVALRHE